MKLHCGLAITVVLLANSFSALAVDPGTNSVPRKTEKRSLKDCLLPAVKNGGFIVQPIDHYVPGN